MKLIESPHPWQSDRLKIILGVSKSGNDAPFAELDAVYHHVLPKYYLITTKRSLKC